MRAVLLLAAFALSPIAARAQNYALHTLASFNGSNGDEPEAGVTLSADGKTVYGTTVFGGSTYVAGTNAGLGTVFSVPASGGSLTTLVNFNRDNGERPYSTPLRIGSTLYGTTLGGPNGEGTAFSVPASGGALTTLTVFGNGLVAGPSAGLILSADGGTFYGTVFNGNNDTVFSLPVTGGNASTLAAFTGPNGRDPYANLTLVGETLYGTTYYGGIQYDPNQPSSGYGTVFSVPVTGGATTTLFGFTSQNGISPDGQWPHSALIPSADGKTLYGTTSLGGQAGYGTVFSIPVGGGALTTLTNFNGTDGSTLFAGVILSADGRTLYGTTVSGGAYNKGEVFSLPVTGGTPTVLFSFDGSNGAQPSCSLVLGSDGTLYGTTSAGGTNNFGTVFALTPTYPLTLSGISPSSKAAGSGAFALTVNGTNFQANSLVKWNGAEQPTTFVSGTRLTADIPASLLTMPGTAAVTVTTPHVATSGTKTFTINHTFTAARIAAGANGTTTLLWNSANEAAFLQTVTAGGTTTRSVTFGPYTGASAKAVAVAPDGSLRLLWTNTNGTAAVWSLTAGGTVTSYGTAYGPYTGSAAAGMTVTADGKTRLLWTTTQGAASVWTLDTMGRAVAYGPTFGPYTGGAHVSAIGGGTDGKIRLLWTNSANAAAVWLLDGTAHVMSYGATYGPYTGASAIAVNGGTDGKSRLLWTNTSGAAQVWTLSTTGSVLSYGTTYGPYIGAEASDLSVGSDNTTLLLWTNTSGQASIWSVTPNGVVTYSPNLGPF